MKKFLLTLAAAAAMVTASAVDYPIYVSGIRVTDANKDDITGTGVVGTDNKGQVTYDPSSKTLRIQRNQKNNTYAELTTYSPIDGTSQGQAVIHFTATSKSETLTIVCASDSTTFIAGGNKPCIKSDGGSIKISNVNRRHLSLLKDATGYIVVSNGGDFILENTSLSIESDGGINLKGSGTTLGSWRNTNSNVDAHVHYENGVAPYVFSVSNTNCDYVNYAGLYPTVHNHQLMVRNIYGGFPYEMAGLPEGEQEGPRRVQIRACVPYNVYVCGIEINSLTNLNDVLGNGSNIAYNRTTQTLTFNNFQLPNYTWPEPFVEIYQDTKVELLGDNQITVEDSTSNNVTVFTSWDFTYTFTGSGNLVATAPYRALYSDDKVVYEGSGTLTFRNRTKGYSPANANYGTTIDGSKNGAVVFENLSGDSVTITQLKRLSGARIFFGSYQGKSFYDNLNNQPMSHVRIGAAVDLQEIIVDTKKPIVGQTAPATCKLSFKPELKLPWDEVACTWYKGDSANMNAKSMVLEGETFELGKYYIAIPNLLVEDGEPFNIKPTTLLTFKYGNVVLSRNADDTTGAIGYLVDGSSAITNTNADVKAVKTFENGHVVIIRNGIKYTIDGRRL